ncbi:MAG: hypothetical protein V7L23_18630 [Nostoc sp.]|uniref:hypothetical protein n=1 Tax=Nostoc sp. TaxID=1180 RepID=UPI002FF22AD6
MTTIASALFYGDGTDDDDDDLISETLAILADDVDSLKEQEYIKEERYCIQNENSLVPCDTSFYPGEPTVYLTGNTSVTGTEMMMSQLPEDICTAEIARELLTFAVLLGTEDFTSERGLETYRRYRRLQKDFLLTDNEVHKYGNIAIFVCSFMNAHNGGHYSTLVTNEYCDD